MKNGNAEAKKWIADNGPRYNKRRSNGIFYQIANLDYMKARLSKST